MDISLDATAIVNDLQHMTYEEVSQRHRVSRGKVYSIALANGARKHERKIRERAAERARLQKSFLQEVINATVKSDVVDYLEGLPDNSVNLHLCSPPYNVGKRYGAAISDHSDSRSFYAYLGWLLIILSEVYRTLAEGGVLFLQVGSTRGPKGTLMPIDCMLFNYLESMGFTFQSRVIWEVPHGLTPKRRLSERHETALVMSKGLVRTFNPTPGRTPQKQPGKKAFKGPNKGKLSGSPLGGWPSNVWRIRNVAANSPERTGHCAQFPEALARRAILLYTLPEDLVVDIFMGSGTSAAVAKRTGRAFSGCDLFYEAERKRRIEQVLPDLVSMLPGVTEESLEVWRAQAQPKQFPAAHVSLQVLAAEERQMHMDLEAE